MHLFVYGTLRRAAGHPMHRSLCAVASFVGDARVRGRLYQIAWYPGLVLDDAAGWVVGELYRLRSTEGLVHLDAYEGDEYRRIERSVGLSAGGEHRAWLYEFRRPIETYALIPSGDFLCPRDRVVSG